MAIENIDLDLNKLKRSYEVSRFKWASKIGIVVLPLVLFSVVFCGNAAAECVAGLVLYATSTLALWRGQHSTKAVRDGFIIGGVVYLIPFALCEVTSTSAMIGSGILGVAAGLLFWRRSSSIDGQSLGSYMAVALPIVSIFALMGGLVLGYYFVALTIGGFLVLATPKLLVRA